jgi:Asp-tRNA(Asn)/Glu-tRNA(Gln) amidotransferase A subunit family amidase
MYLDRLKQYGPKLECVVTLMEEQALEQARRADREIAAGNYRGLLHGIPYGAKDLLATRNAPTTWGAGPYKDQVIDADAAVIQRLEKSGAVLVAKTTLGELAMGDIWFGGKTRNPWDVTQGSSGSSAGSSSGTSAGLFAFAIGSETLGSIVSPASTCGITGLRPTYGRVSRAGAMTLSWSMDKLGPLCRSVEDCAIVFNAIYGPDGVDPTVIKAPFNYTPKVSLSKLRIGYLKSDFDKPGHNQTNDLATLKTLESLGAKLIPIELPQYPVGSISFLLTVEAATAFDELTRSGRDALLVQQRAGDWANSFRAARFVPAVEYLEANRIRWLLIQDMARTMEAVDVYVGPSHVGSNLTLCNLTGHPCVVMPNGFGPDGLPTSITFTGKLFGEATLLAVAKSCQDATDFHKKHPAWLTGGAAAGR